MHFFEFQGKYNFGAYAARFHFWFQLNFLIRSSVKLASIWRILIFSIGTGLASLWHQSSLIRPFALASIRNRAGTVLREIEFCAGASLDLMAVYRAPGWHQAGLVPAWWICADLRPAWFQKSARY